jgi:hypothetical protein
MHQAYDILNMRVSVKAPWAIDKTKDSWIEIYLETGEDSTDSYSVSVQDDGVSDPYG